MGWENRNIVNINMASGPVLIPRVFNVTIMLVRYVTVDFIKRLPKYS